MTLTDKKNLIQLSYDPKISVISGPSFIASKTSEFRPLLSTQEISLPYLAGFFDADGHVSLTMEHSVSISNKFLPTLIDIQDFLQNRMNVHSSVAAKSDKPGNFELRIQNKKDLMKFSVIMHQFCLLKGSEISVLFDCLDNKISKSEAAEQVKINREYDLEISGQGKLNRYFEEYDYDNFDLMKRTYREIYKSNERAKYQYLAGLIDGDGTINTYIDNQPQYHFLISLPSKKRYICKLFCDLFGTGNVYTYASKSELKIYGKKLFPYLKKLVPHLRHKKINAISLLLFRENQIDFQQAEKMLATTKTNNLKFKLSEFHINPEKQPARGPENGVNVGTHRVSSKNIANEHVVYILRFFPCIKKEVIEHLTGISKK